MSSVVPAGSSSCVIFRDDHVEHEHDGFPCHPILARNTSLTSHSLALRGHRVHVFLLAPLEHRLCLAQHTSSSEEHGSLHDDGGEHGKNFQPDDGH